MNRTRKEPDAGRKVDRRARREFAKTLAAVAATPILARPARAQQPSPARPAPQQPPPADAVSPEANALTEVVRARYGKYLKEDQISQVQRSIERGLRTADRLKQLKLANGDEPAFAFSADAE